MNGDELASFDSLWDYADPAGTEARFRALLPAAGKRPTLWAEIMTQIARAEGLQRQFAAAHRTLDRVEATLPTDASRARIRLLLERGRVHNSNGEPERARSFFAEALRLAEDDPAEAYFAVDAAHMLAIVAPAAEMLEWNLRALAMAERATDERARQWRGSLLNNIGWTYQAQGDFAAALNYLMQALVFRQEHGPPAEERVARWCVARVRRDLGQVPAALAEQQALSAEYEALGERSGYVFEEIGECLHLMGEHEAARPYFADAYRELSADAWLVANEPERLERLLALSRGQ